ncbi:MAG: 50S ribosomal protein L19, partial [Clostridia bacterium]|nr:50S ribosomal protein L19 [Clostridia bacterium]
MNEIIRSIENAQLRTDIPKFNIGDTVKVQVKVV